jgi:hypothetical protein
MLACLVTTSPKQLFKGRSWSAATASREAAISRLKDGLSLAGGVVIAVGLISTTNGRAYPGVQALLPTIGTALLIVAGPQAVLNRCLMARRGLVWIGLISYPLYLWHWPLLAFARIAAGGTASLEVRLAVIGLSLALAVLTYRLLERPLRFGAPAGATAAVLLGSMAAIGLFGFGMHKLIAPGSGAFAKVFNQGDIGHDQVFQYMRERFFACTPASLRKEALSWNDSVRCFQSHREGPPRVALIGDSHAEHLFIGLAEAMPATNVVYYIKNAKLDLEGPHFQAILRFAIGNADIRSVVLAVSYARWADGARAAGFERDIGAIVAAFEAAKKKVYFVEDVPGFPVDAARCKFRRIVHSDVVCAASRAVSLGGREAVGAALDALRARYPKLMLARTAVHLCDDVNCHMAKDGTILFRDGHHLNIPGSRFIGRKILEEHPRLAD